MSRTRKYRAWDLEDRVFTHFALSDIDARGGIKTPHGWARVSELDEALITEFVGLKDKNGKEIYEGDILRSGDLSTAPTAGVAGPVAIGMSSLNGMVGMALICTAGRYALTADSDGVCYTEEVIGNVWQNPELLKP